MRIIITKKLPKVTGPAKNCCFYAVLASCHFSELNWFTLWATESKTWHREEWEPSAGKRCPLLAVMVRWHFSSSSTVKPYPQVSHHLHTQRNCVKRRYHQFVFLHLQQMLTVGMCVGVLIVPSVYVYALVLWNIFHILSCQSIQDQAISTELAGMIFSQGNMSGGSTTYIW